MIKSIKISVMALIIIGVIQLLIAQDAPSLTKSEQTALRSIATEWVNLGEWCVEKKMGPQARECVEKAETADSTAPGFGSLKEKANACEDAGTESDFKTYESRLTSVSRKVAMSYEQLFNAGAQEKDSKVKERFDKYLIAAVELVPSDSRWNNVLTVVNNLVKDKKFDRVANMAERALVLNPPEKIIPVFKAAIDSVAIENLVLKTISSHPIKYYFSLPKDYKKAKDKKWPVLICVDGAGSDFKVRATRYKDKRDKLPYILVGPCTFSNTNAIQGNMLNKYHQFYSDDIINEANHNRFAWDEQGILAIINELQSNYDAESRVYITGFSGGGNAMYMMIFRHSDLLNGAAPACANFMSSMSRVYANLKGRFLDEDLNIPIHFITGEKDPHRDAIEKQTNYAESFSKELGYSNCKRTMVPDMGHSAAEDQVIATFKSYWEGKKKRSDKLE
jgi:predicted esterase